MEKVTIKRCDGTIYERKKREVELDYNITFRVKKSQINKLKKITNQKGLNYSSVIRELIDKYIEENNN